MIPMIYTSKGNLPIESLKYETQWEVKDAYIKFTETYTMDGEVVRQSAHVYDKEGLVLSGAAGSFKGA